MKHLLLAALALPALAFAQGSLTPPGAPAETMKTLTQIEPRTPVERGAPGVSAEDNGGFTIFRPGSYYLTASFSVGSGNGITIASTSPAAEGSGVLFDRERSNVAVLNGHIRSTTTYGTEFIGSGFLNGVYGAYTNESCRVSTVSVHGVGAQGIYLAGVGSIVSDCGVTLCGGIGISATKATDCSAWTCGSNGIVAMVASNCVGGSVGASGSGIAARVAINCSGYATAGTGISALATATNCRGSSSSGAGLATETASNCVGASVEGIGLSATTAENCTGSSDTNTGLLATATASGCAGTSNSGIGLRTATAENCQGTSTSGTGLHAEETAAGCTGVTTTGSDGLYAGRTATTCRGNNKSGTGISYGLRVSGTATGCSGYAGLGRAGLSARVALNCEGTCPGGNYGLLADDAATNCSGSILAASNTVANSAGLRAGVATGCNAQNLSTVANTYGIYALISAHNSVGGGVIGVRAASSANYCHGVSTLSGGTAISTSTAIGCTSGGGLITATNKYLTP